jgi:hypothetical protein
MNKRSNLPVEGKAIRFAPGHNQVPSAGFWKVWAEGNEVYASARTPQGLAKISVHASGQIHYRLGPKQKQDLAPLMQLAGGPWMHAFEIRFLLSEGANAPTGEKESLKNKAAYLISVPQGRVLYANLIVGAAGTTLSSPLPAQFGGGQALWRAQLRDGRTAILVGRMLPLDSHNRDEINYIREQLKPTATFSSMPSRAYIEILHLHWSPEGGNVVQVVPMGNEAIRSEQETTPPSGLSDQPRMFQYQSPHSTVEVVAPNGFRVAVLELDSVDEKFELVKNRPSTHNVGVLKVRVEQSNLIAGSKFMASPCWLECIPAIGGGSPHNWAYAVFARFDGSALTIELRQNSVSLRNCNLAKGISQLDDGEELVMTMPLETLKLVATLDAPATSMDVVGRFILRDSR